MGNWYWLPINKEVWMIYNNIPFRSWSSSKLRWFQYKIIHRILTTNKSAFLYKIQDSPLCTFCKRSEETIKHILFDCVHVKRLWQRLLEWIEYKTGIVLEPTLSNIIFGYIEKRNDVLNLIFTVTKYFIYTCKYQNKRPNINGLKAKLQDTYYIHKQIFYTKCRYDIFTSFWSSCHNLFI